MWALLENLSIRDFGRTVWSDSTLYSMHQSGGGVRDLPPSGKVRRLPSGLCRMLAVVVVVVLALRAGTFLPGGRYPASDVCGLGVIHIGAMEAKGYFAAGENRVSCRDG